MSTPLSATPRAEGAEDGASFTFRMDGPARATVKRDQAGQPVVNEAGEVLWVLEVSGWMTEPPWMQAVCTFEVPWPVGVDPNAELLAAYLEDLLNAQAAESRAG